MSFTRAAAPFDRRERRRGRAVRAVAEARRVADRDTAGLHREPREEAQLQILIDRERAARARRERVGHDLL